MNLPEKGVQGCPKKKLDTKDSGLQIITKGVQNHSWTLNKHYISNLYRVSKKIRKNNI